MLAAARADVIAKITAEGVQVVDDPRNIVPPCVLVGMPRRLTRQGACLVNATLPVTVIAPPPGNLDAATWLLDTTEQLMATLSAETAETGTTSAPSSQTRLPTYTLEVPIP